MAVPPRRENRFRVGRAGLYKTVSVLWPEKST